MDAGAGNWDPATIEGFVLAGGRSSRMGSDKALALFAGKPLVETALGILRGAGLSARIAGSRSALGSFAAEVPDTFVSVGPLGGVHAGLAASVAKWCVFLPVDMPLMPSAFLACLLERASQTGAPVTVAQLNGRIEPFPVVLSREVLPFVTRRLETGETACHKAWQSIPLELGKQFDAVSAESMAHSIQCRHPRNLPPVLWFQSANTPSELAELNRIFS